MPAPLASKAPMDEAPIKRRGRPRTSDRGLVTTLILTSALDLFRRQGLASTSIEQVASAAGASKTTIYRHFGSKEALAEAAVAYDGQKVLETIRQVAIDAEAPLDRLRQLTTAIADFVALPSTADLYRFSISAVPSVPAVGHAFAETGTALQMMMEPLIREAQASGLLRDGNARVLARQLYDAVITPIWGDALLLEPYVRDPEARNALFDLNWDGFMRGARPRD
jgi:AcrR family transcriptional regulator